MWPVAIDVAWCVCVSVGHRREPYKTAEPIEMLFGLWSQVCRQIPPGQAAIGERHIPPCCTVLGENTVSCRETADPIGMAFGLWTWVSQRNHELGGAWIPRGKEQV